MRLLFVFTIISIVSYVGVAIVRWLAYRHNVLDIPNERSSHTASVPRGGGLVIVVITVVGVWVYQEFYPELVTKTLVAYTVSAIVIAVVSGLDDLYTQPTWLRLAIHSVAAALAIYGCGYLPLRHLLGRDSTLVWAFSLILTFMWIVGLTNAYNFMDGIDGIASGQAVLAGLGWVLLGWLSGQPLVTVFGLLLAASTSGFLVHNWSPARIFMGDVGSAFIGFTLAVLPLIYNTQLDLARRGLSAALVGMIFVWPFVFDATFTFLRRLRHGERVFSPHRSHLYQRLVIAGHTHQFVAVLYSSLAAVGLVVGLGWRFGIRNFSWLLAIMLPLLCLGLWFLVCRREQKTEKPLGSDLSRYADTV